jgi:hypothetical protein
MELNMKGFKVEDPQQCFSNMNKYQNQLENVLKI